MSSTPVAGVRASEEPGCGGDAQGKNVSRNALPNTRAFTAARMVEVSIVGSAHAASFVIAQALDHSGRTVV